MITSFRDVQKLARTGNVVPVTVEFPSDLLTPAAAFLRLSQGGSQAFLLESVEGGQRLARYSFLGVDPDESLSIEDGALHIRSPGQHQRLEGNPMALIGEYLSQYRAAAVPGLPPFTGGAVGYLGYECSGYLESIPAPKHRSCPNDAHLMVFRNVVAFDHVRQRVVLISNILTSQTTLKSGYERAEADLRSLRKKLLKQSLDEKPLVLRDEKDLNLNLPGMKAELGKKAFTRAVQKIKGHIRAGDIFQCVVSDQFRFDLKVPPFLVYRALRTVSPAPYLFYLSFGEEKLLGASPEMLTRVSSDKRVETCPIAGTRPRSSDPVMDRKFEKSLLASEKERAEHLMLVDLGRNDIGRVAKPGSVKVREFMQVQRFSHVMHLVSLVEGSLKPGKSAWDALMACFPAGTLSGAPKIRAMQIIAEQEKVRRGPYGGAVVYYDFSGRLDSCIAIRSLYVRGRKAIIQAGAGIVADSQAAREYDEVLNKTKALRKAVAMALR